ncbi:MAG: type II toxin-antitoxin system ParD family antitoxin [Candidatus Hydrogenedentota bacterium]
MTTLNISLPEKMRDHVDEQTKTGGFSTASEYVRSLIRDDQKRKAQERLQGLLLEGLNSGDAEELTQETWDEIRRAVFKGLKDRGTRA